eukprot:scaffold418827_cov46-Prasinocladus_malaysianus.AAC.1
MTYATLMCVQIAREGEDAVSNLEIVRHPYNYAHELERKRRLALAWAQSTGMENPEDARVLEVRLLPPQHSLSASSGGQLYPA